MDQADYRSVSIEYERPGLPFGVVTGTIEMATWNANTPRIREDMIAVLTDDGVQLIPTFRIIRIVMGVTE